MVLFGAGEYKDLDISQNKKQQKHKPSLLEMAEKEFLGDDVLIEEIKKYLLSRRASRNYPTRVSWEMQLKLLKKIPEQQRVQSVRRSTLNGYRQIAFDTTSSSYTSNTYNTGENLTFSKSDSHKHNISKIGF